jgi:hypothetical protein
MPWFAQQTPDYCVPASIQMWAAYNGNRVSQTTIANYVGTVQFIGTPALNVAPGVDHFTATTDANLLSAFYTSPAQFASMQISSINNQRPLIAVFSEQHVVVVSGGSWHHDDNTGWNVWDSVIYQDPSTTYGGPDRELDASTWMNAITSMVIGGSAAADAQANFDQYGGTVAVRGSVDGGGPRQY